jgi:hypothetical protein
MLMGYVEAKKQSQQDDGESEPKRRWVSCPDMPDGLLIVDDEAPQKIPRRHSTENANDNCQDGQYEDWGE